MKKREIKIGERFGQCTILKELGGTRRKVLCQCACGIKKRISVKDLWYGGTKSCGCLRNKKSSDRMKGYAKEGRLVGSKNGRWKGGIGGDTQRYNNERRVRELGAMGSHTTGDWETLKAQYNWTCPACNKSEPKIKLTEDHVVPLIKGGSDNIENIQPLCGSCNSRKHTKIIKYKLTGGDRRIKT